ncbi:MAG: hypothetical protein HY834_02035 [Devosia nanyangense]|uniref:Uncharacterized protein n=1 Tax=Devosia nanyangense TaxID=1228055 RepID=A0A933L0U5_9HYPH|nr:hypothetical protein [Devosia nanyangense]
MAATVPAPELVEVLPGHRSYRYTQKTLEQALVLKAVRALSGLRSLAVLEQAGLALDVGATMRTLDELSSDIMFLAGPSRTGTREPRHDEYLAEFYQEEFDHVDPLQATQSRHRVSRRDIRAYIARTYAGIIGADVSSISAVYETIDNAYSGYVHGAAGHIIDVYDGRTFRVPLSAHEGPQAIIERQTPGYAFRTVGSLTFAAQALGLSNLAYQLHQLAGSIADVDV